jgi:hypothetical protein
VNEARRQSRRCRFVALHRIGDQDRIASGQFDGVAARDFRAARDPAKRWMQRLVHRHDERVELALAHEPVQVGEHVERVD